MPSDRELYLDRYTRYGHIVSDAQAAEKLALAHNLSVDSVRGRLSRANTPQNNLLLAERLAKEPPAFSTSQRRQTEVHTKSRRALSQHMALQSRKSSMRFVGLFDIHYPYTRFDALELAMLLMGVIQPDTICFGGDDLDNEGLGRWEDTRSVYDKLFSADVFNKDTGSGALYRALIKQHRSAYVYKLTGNHCMWLFNHLREKDPQHAEQRIAEYSEALLAEGLHTFSTTREEPVRVHSHLNTWHGQFTSPNHMLNARNTLGQFVETGEAITTVVGHTHRPIHIPGSSVGYSGVDYFNAPCLSRVERIPWLKRDPKAWGLGIFYAEMGLGWGEGQNIIFKPRGNKLTAQWQGVTYEVPLKE